MNEHTLLALHPWEVRGLLDGTITRISRPQRPTDAVVGTDGYTSLVSPFGPKGGSLLGQEAWAPTKFPCMQNFAYEADGFHPAVDAWLPAADMPAEAARIRMRVKCVLLGFVSGAMRAYSWVHEGIRLPNEHDIDTPAGRAAREAAFRDRWDQTYPDTPYDTRPWRWVADVQIEPMEAE